MMLFWWPGGSFVAMSEFWLEFEEEHSLPSYCVLYSTQRSLQFRQKKVAVKWLQNCFSLWILLDKHLGIWNLRQDGLDRHGHRSRFGNILAYKIYKFGFFLVISFWESLTKKSSLSCLQNFELRRPKNSLHAKVCRCSNVPKIDVRHSTGPSEIDTSMVGIWAFVLKRCWLSGWP